jgi:predicted regulator of Ras-like GTPase activity (Roadblock/LC7/MglB family)
MTRTEIDVTETPAITIKHSALAKTNEDRVFKKLQQILIEICKTNGIAGFTLKNSTQAAVKLGDARELPEFALLASQLFVSSEELSEFFGVGVMKNVVLEGARVIILCLSIEGNQISVFMDKSVDCGEVLKRILSKCGSV